MKKNLIDTRIYWIVVSLAASAIMITVNRGAGLNFLPWFKSMKIQGIGSIIFGATIFYHFIYLILLEWHKKYDIQNWKFGIITSAFMVVLALVGLSKVFIFAGPIPVSTVGKWIVYTVCDVATIAHLVIGLESVFVGPPEESELMYAQMHRF